MEIRKKSELDKFQQSNADSKDRNESPVSDSFKNNSFNYEVEKSFSNTLVPFKNSNKPREHHSGKIWHESMEILQLTGKYSRNISLESDHESVRDKLEVQAQKSEGDNTYERHNKTNQRQYVMDAGDHTMRENKNTKCLNKKDPSRAECVGCNPHIKHKDQHVNRIIPVNKLLSLKHHEASKKVSSACLKLRLNKVSRSGRDFWQRHQLLQTERNKWPENRRKLKASMIEDQTFGPVVKVINLQQTAKPIAYYY